MQVRTHARRVLEAPLLAERARARRVRELLRAGRRVVDGGLTSATRWELRDLLTGSVVARGDDGPAGLDAALADAYHSDDLFAEIPGADPVTPGIPPSLARAIGEWIGDPGTPDEEIAEFVGWPVARVRECR
ncbi:hypothetical protein GCM10010435_29380 [Winogradskya consettensis]|uniref:Uncharacterized protein n=1 Tax=Winogradskya consettensis TaxID=113560 RepID=A0A919VLN4_9ACTN|nr:hypothetical protein [Actinoplanes consettensis]GIM70794.1 hypothetical protein Aco04nite_22120 [Actinoplanes consettensis]